MNRGLLSLLMTMGLPMAAFSEGWTTIRSGLEIMNSSFVDQGRQIGFVLLKYDSKQSNSLHIIDTYNKVGIRPYSEYSIDAIQRITGATVVVNAGSTKSYNLPDPAGLLKIDGTIVSRVDTGVEHGGVLCVSRRGFLSIYEVSQTLDPAQMGGSNCVDAVQRGPYLSSRAPYTAQTWNSRFRRTVAGFDGDGNLLILVTRDGATLAGVSDFFFGRQSNLGILTLLNFDGDESSGLIIRDKRGDINVEVGNIHGLIGSAIAIY